MKALLGLLVLVMGSAQAATVTVDFESAPTGWISQLQTQGFNFTSTATNGNEIEIIVFDYGPNDSTDLSLAYCPDFCDLRMTRTDGTNFSISSATIFNIGGAGNPYTITGLKAGGETLLLETSISGNPATVSFGADWVNLEAVVFGVGELGTLGTAIDDIVTTVVPLPPAAWLFVSALALLGWKRK